MKLPRHIVIIPDGNRRWAKKNNKTLFSGHKEGSKIVRKILKEAINLKITYITFWGCSVNNVTKRSNPETDFLFEVFEQFFKEIAVDETIINNRVKIKALGKWETLFPEKTKNQIKGAIKSTGKNNSFTSTFLLAYSGKDEMIEAVTKIAGNKNNFPINEKMIKDNLWTRDLPPVDLVIRTGGEPHWSAGLMMWDVAEARLYFTETFWPDFSAKEFKTVIGIYGKTERRFGK